MSQSASETLLCTRIYTCLLHDERVEVTASVFIPVKAEGGEYGCRYILEMPEDQLERTIYGIDSLQALHLALFMLRNDLMLLEGASDWRWLGARGLGLPLTSDEEGGNSFQISTG